MRAALAGLLALASAIGIGRFVFTPILPAMATALALSKSQAGLIASANFAGYLVGALALLVWRPSRRRGWCLGALVVGAGCTAAMGATDGMSGFVLLRFIGGVAGAVVLVLGSALVLDRLIATRTGRLAPLHYAGVGAGIAASAVLVSAMEMAGGGWRALWLGAGALAGGVVPLIAWLLTEAGASVAAPGARPRAAPRAGLARLTVCHALFGVGYIVTATFLVAAVRDANIPGGLGFLVWPLVGLAAMPSTAGWSWVATRIGVRRAYALAAVLEAAGVVAGGVWPGAAGAVLAAVLLGATFMGLTALGFMAAREVSGAEGQAYGFALLTAGFGGGQMAGPLLAGMLLDRTGSFALPSLLAGAALLLAAVLVWRPEPVHGLQQP